MFRKIKIGHEVGEETVQLTFTTSIDSDDKAREQIKSQFDLEKLAESKLLSEQS